MTVRIHKIRFNFKNTFVFGSTSNSLLVPDTLTATTQGTSFHYNPDYSCKCRLRYFLLSDPYNFWRKQEEPVDSISYITRSYRLGRVF